MSPRGKATTPPVVWSNYQLAVVLGIRASTLSRMRNGLLNPNVSQMKKLEAVLGWPASEQIDLLPMSSEDADMRYSMAFNGILNEWMDANPRTVPHDELVPLVRTRREGGGRKKKV